MNASHDKRHLRSLMMPVLALAPAHLLPLAAQSVPIVLDGKGLGVMLDGGYTWTNSNNLTRTPNVDKIKALVNGGNYRVAGFPQRRE